MLTAGQGEPVNIRSSITSPPFPANNKVCPTNGSKGKGDRGLGMANHHPKGRLAHFIISQGVQGAAGAVDAEGAQDIGRFTGAVEIGAAGVDVKGARAGRDWVVAKGAE